ncbi:hypothetical protein [Pseudonocardia alni]|uniref:hypothetical protein n=1 Tax=Pseudonocardia alni TaxID=33907 RepID=UPI00340910A4
MPAGCLMGCVGPRSGPDHFCVVRLAAAPLPGRSPSGRRLRLVVELDRGRAGDEVVVLTVVDLDSGRYVGAPWTSSGRASKAAGAALRACAAVLRPAVA